MSPAHERGLLFGMRLALAGFYLMFPSMIFIRGSAVVAVLPVLGQFIDVSLS